MKPMAKRWFLTGALALVAALSLSLAATPAQALPLELELDYEFSGATPPASLITPWLTATFTDTAAGEVTLTLDATNLTGVEFVGQWYFNLDPNYSTTNLGFGSVSGDGPNSIAFGTDDFKADGDGWFDIALRWDANRFGATSTASLVFICPACAGFDASAFDFYSVNGGGAGTYRTAAHVQGIDPGGNESGWIGDSSTSVPEPSTILLLGSGLVGLGLVRRRFKG